VSAFPQINWITQGKDLNDYRPAIGPDGQTAVFERTFVDSGVPTRLYKVTSLDDADPRPLVAVSDPLMQQTRPDWCWEIDRIAFNSDHARKKDKRTGSLTLSIVDRHGDKLVDVPNSEGFLYPQWNKAGTALTVMNKNEKSAQPRPCTSVIDSSGKMLRANVIGNDRAGAAMCGGMPAVNPSNDKLVAYAGQPALGTWNAGKEGALYDENTNYIFLNAESSGLFSSAPMEDGATLTRYSASFHGRAPAWSPDGRYIVFESIRNADTFALFLFDRQGTGYPVQLTDPSHEAHMRSFSRMERD
jgi:hypothetical protein